MIQFKYRVAVSKPSFLGMTVVAGTDELNDAKNVLLSYKNGVILDEDNKVIFRRGE